MLEFHLIAVPQNGGIMTEPGDQPGERDPLDETTDQNPEEEGGAQSGQPDFYRYVPTPPAATEFPDWELPAYAEEVQLVEPPSKTKQVLCSLWFYLVVMAIPTALVWVLAVRVSTGTTRWSALGITLCTVSLCLVRAVRGNMINAEAEVADELLTSRPPVSNRLAKQLWHNETLEWETRRHPISIIPTVLRRLTASKFRLVLTLTYLVVFGIAWSMHAWMGVTVTAVGILAVGFTVLEWSRVRYAITTERIMAVEKLIGKKVPAMPRSKLTDVVVSEHWFAVFLAWLRIVRVPWGTWDVETAGQDQALKYIHFLPGAVIAAAVFSLGRTPGSGDGT